MKIWVNLGQAIKKIDPNKAETMDKDTQTKGNCNSTRGHGNLANKIK